MSVIVPADANETIGATRFMAENDGPMYLRLNRNDYDNVTEEGAPFKFGEPTVLKDGTDVTVFACGVMVGKALAAARELEGKVSVRVVNVSTIKPLNVEKINELAKDVKGVVTAEEHSVIGGLGGAVAEALSKACKPIEFVGVEDRFGSSAHNYDDIMKHLGLTTEHIAEAIEKINNL